MKQSYFYLFIALFLLISCGNQPDLASKLYAEIDPTAPLNTLTAKEQQAGWQLLFDGSTTNGWHGYNMQGVPDVWSVEDQCIVVHGEGGDEEQDIITNNTYRNFAFTVEYKLSTGSNSGILFQVKEDPTYSFSYETGPEVQLIDNEGYPGKLEEWQTHGANYAMYPPKAKPYHPAGEWNRLLIVVNGNQVTHILNGVLIVDYEKYSDEWTQLRHSGKWANYPDYGKFDEGNIALQNHGSKLWFRNIKIKEL